jgi:tetratricopeptide (TPR) repeat protein
MPKKSSSREKLSRKQESDLDIEIGFLEGIIKRDPHYVEALQVLGDDYTKRGRLQEGLQVDELLAQLRPKDSLVQYNLACSYALTSRLDLAVQALEQALRLGYRDFQWLAEDPDLESLRQHPLYRRILAKIRLLRIKVP